VNPQDPLANLHPLREPAFIGWWPLAPGWWLLLALALICLATVVYFLVRRYRARAYRRRALAQLQQLQQAYQGDGDASTYIGRANALLKTVALISYPRRQVAASNGEEWLAFLNGSMKSSEQFESAFVTAAYQKDCPELNMAQVHRVARSWIKQHGVAR
jgi:hypothetical protein